MIVRATAQSSWISVVGVVVLLVGLAWDAVLHRRDPALAEREGVFTLSNPGHVLFGAGIAIATVGCVLFLLGRLQSHGRAPWWRRLALAAPIVGLAVLFGISFSLAMTSDGGLAAEHHHDHGADSTPADEAAHDHSHGSSAGHDHSAAASDDGHHHAADADEIPTADEQAAADDLVADTRSGTARFADFAVAEGEGYVQVTPYNRGSWGAAHFHNPAYAADGSLLNPTHPEDLIYLKLQDGRVVLLGVMYLAPRGEGPDVGGPLTDWHTHDHLCIAPGAKLRPSIGGRCIGGGQPVENEMMHVWVFDHPGGPLAHDLGRIGMQAALAQFGGDADQTGIGDDRAATAIPQI